VETERKKAIVLAIGEARPGDIVLLAGKGHEKMQVTREGARAFDDVEVAREALRLAGFDCESAGAVVGTRT
jgi:UDP-N-acetylmuramoyl-L-alanyl-D-glutamate--2,6-diaminopimelate ligase